MPRRQKKNAPPRKGSPSVNLQAGKRKRARKGEVAAGPPAKRARSALDGDGSVRAEHNAEHTENEQEDIGGQEAPESNENSKKTLIHAVRSISDTLCGCDAGREQPTDEQRRFLLGQLGVIEAIKPELLAEKRGDLLDDELSWAVASMYKLCQEPWAMTCAGGLKTLETPLLALCGYEKLAVVVPWEVKVRGRRGKGPVMFV